MNIKPILLSCVAVGLMLTTYMHTPIVIWSSFESGSIGDVTQINADTFTLKLRDDNFNAKLSDEWRRWWSFKVHDTSGRHQKINLNLSHLGWDGFYPPFYSYDNQTWLRMDEHHVMQSPECDHGVKNCVLSFTQPLQSHHVALAFFIPYPVSKLEHYLTQIKNHPAVQINTLGYSSVYQFPIQHIIITSPNSTTQQARIWIHARTHPGETPGNFMLEGLIDFLLSEDITAINMREKFIFHIVPMHNPDGVYTGNYRTNPHSINLEEAWIFDKNDPARLTTDAPQENQLLNQVMQSLLTDEIPVKIALNFHATYGEIDEKAYTFPHFGADPHLYSEEEIRLWENQFKFMQHLSNAYDGRIESMYDGGRGFLNRFHPETWWWFNTKDKVLAMTMEATYGKAGFDHWVTDVEHRELGHAIAKAINAYFE